MRLDMIPTRTATAVFMLLACSTSAHADWQYTHWGDTSSEVLNASAGSARPNTDRSQDPSPLIAKLVSPYAAAGVQLKAFLIFDAADRLTYVDLQSNVDPDCDHLAFELGKTYGPPEQTGSFGLRKWWDRKNGNIVIYSRIVGCKVRYMGIEQAGKAGGL